MNLERTAQPISLLATLSIVMALAACQPAKVSNTGSGANGAGNGSGSGTTGANGGPTVDPARPPTTSGPGIDLPDAASADAGGTPGAGKPQGPGDRCAADVFSAEVAPLDLLLLVDSSGSMREKAGPLSKWDMAKGALAAFLKDPKSAGLGAGLQFFPYFGPPKACMTDADCGGLIIFPPGGNFRCHGRAACVGPSAPLSANSQDCALRTSCGAGLTCTPLGRCTMSGGDCAPIGQPCSGGVAGDMCMEVPKTCDALFGDDAGSCMSTDYETPVVPIMPLPDAQVALNAALDHHSPNGGTPMAPAVTGALAHLRKHLGDNPGRRGVLVLATDGLPQNCDTGNSIADVAAALAAGHAAMPALSTYVIGVFDPATLAGSPDALAMLAAAGGTGMPFVLTPGADLTQKFIDSLNQIRGAALACEFQIPKAMGTGQIDFGKVNVRIGSGGVDAGTTAAVGDDLIYVAKAASCDPMRGGWYYDVDPATGTPTRVLTCPATCARLKDAKDIKVELLFGCQSRID